MSTFTGDLLFAELVKFLCPEMDNPLKATKYDIEKAVSKINLMTNYWRCSCPDTVYIKPALTNNRYFRYPFHYIFICILFFSSFDKIFRSYNLNMNVFFDLTHKVSPEEYKFPFLMMSKEGVNRIFGIESIQMSPRSVAILEPLYTYMKYHYDLMLNNVNDYVKTKLLKFDVREIELLDLIRMDYVSGDKDKPERLFNYIRIKVPSMKSDFSKGGQTLDDVFKRTIQDSLYKNTDNDKKIKLINLYSNTFIGDTSYLYYIVYPDVYQYKNDIDSISQVVTMNEPKLLNELSLEKKPLIMEDTGKKTGGDRGEIYGELVGGTVAKEFGNDVTNAVGSFFEIQLGKKTESTTKEFFKISKDDWKIRELENDSIRIINGLNKLESFIYYGYMFLSNNINISQSESGGATLQKLHKYFSNIPSLLYKDTDGNYRPLRHNNYIQAYLRAWLLYAYMLYVNDLLVSIIPIIQKMSGYDLLELPRFLMKQDKKYAKEIRLWFAKGVQGISLTAHNENEVWPCRAYYDELFVAFKTAVGMQTEYTNIDNLFIDTTGTSLRVWCEKSMMGLVSSMSVSSLEDYNTLEKLHKKSVDNIKISDDIKFNVTDVHKTAYSEIYQNYQQDAMIPAVEKYKNYMRYIIVKTYENFRDILDAYSSESSNQTGGGEELEIGRRELLQSIHLFNTPFYRIGYPSLDVASKFQITIPGKVDVPITVPKAEDTLETVVMNITIIESSDTNSDNNSNMIVLIDDTEEINLQVILEEQ